MFLTGSGDEVCELLTALFQAVVYHLPTINPSAFPVFVYWKFQWRSAPCLSPLLWHTQSTLPPLLHVSFQFLVFYSVFVVVVVCRAWVSLSRGLWWFIPGVAMGIPAMVWISQAGLELASCGTGALPFSQCIVVWRSFVQAGGSGFDSSWWFFSAKCGSSIQQNFWLMELILSASAL
jgi:hypothetical protein